MKVSDTPKVAAICSAVIIFNFSSCKYEDGPLLSLRTKKERLVGRWEVETLWGESQNGNDYDVIVEFEKDGDMRFGYIYEYGDYYYAYFIKGDWDWDDGKSSLEFDVYGENYSFEIKRLTDKELVLDHDDGEWELEKIKE